MEGNKTPGLKPACRKAVHSPRVRWPVRPQPLRELRLRFCAHGRKLWLYLHRRAKISSCETAPHRGFLGIGRQGIEFQQHHPHRRVRNYGDHVVRSPGHAAQGLSHGRTHRLALPQVAFHQVRNHAAGASSRAAQASRLRPSTPSLPTSTRSAAISQASFGFAEVFQYSFQAVHSLQNSTLLQFKRPAAGNAIAGRDQSWSAASGQ